MARVCCQRPGQSQRQWFMAMVITGLCFRGSSSTPPGNNEQLLSANQTPRAHPFQRPSPLEGFPGIYRALSHKSRSPLTTATFKSRERKRSKDNKAYLQCIAEARQSWGCLAGPFPLHGALVPSAHAFINCGPSACSCGCCYGNKADLLCSLLVNTPSGLLSSWGLPWDGDTW